MNIIILKKQINKKVLYVGTVGSDLDGGDLFIHKFVLNNKYTIEGHEVILIVESSET